MKMYFMAGGVLAAMLAAAPAFTQMPAPSAPQLEHRMDSRDRHSAVRTRAAVPDQVRNLFARLDTNRDGFIAKAEADAGKGQRAGRGGKARRNRAAADPQAVQQRRGAAFARLDANRDGMISRGEFESRPVRANRAGRGMRGARFGMAGLRGRMFERTDSNRDGRVSIEEVTLAAYQRFDRSDLNRDGQLTPDERRGNRQRGGPNRG